MNLHSFLSKKQIGRLALCVAVLSMTSPSLFAAVNETFTQDGLLYTVTAESGAKYWVSVKAAPDFNNSVVTIPDSVENNGKKYAVTAIPTDGFRANKTITSLVFSPNSQLTSIGNYAFYQCSNLGGDLTIPASLTSLNTGCFRETAITSVKFPDTKVGSLSLGSEAFRDCPNLGGDLYITKAVKSMGNNVFYPCYRFTGIQFAPDCPITSIGSGAFNAGSYHPVYADTLVLPSKVAYIYSSAFSNIEFKAIKLTNPTAPKVSANAFYGSTCPIFIPEGTYFDYTQANGWTVAYQLRLRDGKDYTLERNGILYYPTSDTTVAVIGCTGAFDGVVTVKDTIQVGGRTFFSSEIAPYAFQNKTNIKGLDIKNSKIAYIREYAFDGCSQLDGTIDFPNTLKTIERYAFQANSKLKGIQLNEGLETINDYAFNNCTGISGTIVFPSTLTKILSYAFYGNSSITGVVFKEGLTTIGTYAFGYCTNITGTIVFPSTLETLGDLAFRFNYMLNNIVFTPNGKDVFLTIRSYAFQGCSKLSGDLVFPTSVKRILGYAFSECGVFTSILLPESGLDSISDYAFYRPTLPDKSTGTLHIPASLSGIGQNAFFNQAFDSIVIAQRPTPPNLSTNSGMFDGSDYPIYIPYGTYYSYCAAPGWSPYAARLNDGIVSAFEQDGLKYIALTDSTVQVIGCTDRVAGTLRIPRQAKDMRNGKTYTITEIGADAFKGNSTIDKLILEDCDSLQAIGQSAFRESTILTDTIVFPASLKSIGKYAFNNCKKLQGVKFQEGLETIYESAFYNCTALGGQIVFPSTLKKILANAFRYTAIGGIIDIPASVENIYNDAFRDNPNIEGVRFAPNSKLTSISSTTFYNCPKLSGVIEIPESVTSIGTLAFAQCGQITAIILHEGLKNINQGAFTRRATYAKDTVDTLIIPSTVTTIQYNAFKNQNFKYIKVLATTPPVLYIEPTNKTADMFYGSTCDIRIPDGLYDTYCAPQYGWELYSRRLDDGVVREFTHDHVIYIPMTESTAMVAGVESAYSGAIHIPDTVEYDARKYAVVQIMPDAFLQNENITGATLSNGLRSIGDNAFNGCTNLTGSVTIPSSVVTIGISAFNNTSRLEQVLFAPNSQLKTIGAYAFANSGIAGVLDIPASVDEIGTYAFYNDKNIEGVRFNGNNLRYIRSYAFYGCTKLSGTIEIPGSLLGVETYAFYNCPFREIKLHEGLLSIGDYAFRRATSASYLKDSVEALVIPKTTTYIGQYAFCDLRLKDITLLNPEPARVHTNGRMFDGSQCPIHIPAGSYFAYVNTDIWKNYKYRYTDGVVEEQTVGNLRIMPVSDTTAQVLGLADNSFRGTLTIPVSARLTVNEQAHTFHLTTIADSAFKATNIQGLVFAEGSRIQEIGAYAFAGCKQLADTVKLPASLLTIGTYAFDGDLNIQYVVFREGLKAIGSYAFSNCSALQGIVQIPASVVEIGAAAFYKDINIRGVAFAEDSRLEYIRSSAFSYCTNLKGEILIPAKVKSIEGSAFYACGDITAIRFLGNNITNVSSSAFRKTVVSETVLDTLRLPSSLSTMGSDVFSNQKFRQIVIGARVPPTIGTNVFYGDTCRIVIPEGTRFVYSETQGWNAYPERLYDGTDGAVSYDGIIRIAPISSTTAAVVGLVDSRYDSVVVIPDSALLTIGDITRKFKVVSIQQNAFKESRISGLTISEGIESIEHYAFMGCASLQSDLVIPATVKTIGNYAFQQSGIPSLRLQEGLTSIGTYAFDKCKGIHGAVIIPNSVTTIGNYAFRYCENLTEITLSKNVSVLNTGVFQYCKNLTRLTLPEGALTSIGGSTFHTCTSLAEVSIPQSVTKIDAYAFYECTSLTSIPLPAGLQTIGTYAFCCVKTNSLVSGLVIPDKVSSIGENAFLRRDFTTITVKGGAADSGTYPPVLDSKGGMFDGSTCAIRIPDGQYELYCSPAYGWGPYAGRLDDGSLREFSVAGLRYLPIDQEHALVVGTTGRPTNITIPATVTNNAKTYSITSIGKNAFRDSTFLTSVQFAEDSRLNTISDYAFSGCTKLVGELTLPASVREVGYYAFNGVKITRLHFADGSQLQTIGNYAFNACTALADSIIIPNSVQTIGNYAFYNTAIDSLYLGTGNLRTIGSRAFSTCKKLAGEIRVPNTVETIGTYAFEQTLLRRVTLPENAKFVTVPEGIFYSCSQLAEMAIPEQVTAINKRAFYYCPSLCSFTFSERSLLQTIGDEAFRCQNTVDALQTMYIPRTVQTIGSSVFYNRSFAHMELYNPMPATMGTNVFDGANATFTYTIYIPRNSYFDYSETSAWTPYAKRLTDGTNYSHKSGHLNIVVLSRTTAQVAGFVAGEEFNAQPLEIPATVKLPKHEVGAAETDSAWYRVVEIAANAFKDEKRITTLTIGDKVETIGANAFYGCQATTGVLTIPASVKNIGSAAFQNTTFSELVFAEGAQVKIINSYAFAGCKNLKGTLTLPSSVGEVASYAFQKDASLTGLLLPENLKTIQQNAFDGCSGLTTLTIPASVKTIGASAFYECTGLTSITIEKGDLTTIDGSAFKSTTINNKDVQDIEIPANVQSIGASAFENRWFNTITVRSKIPCTLGDKVFNYGEGSIYVPAGTYGKYTTADVWKTYKKTNGEFRITDGIHNIEHTVVNLVVKNTSDTTAYVIRVEEAFTGAELLIPRKVTLTESLGGTSADYAIDSIANEAFSYNNTITTVVLDSIVPPRTSGKNANLFNPAVTSLKLPCGSFDNYRNDAYFGSWAGEDWEQKFITRCEPLEIYHYTTPSEEVTKVFTDPFTGQITYKRTFQAGRWEPLYLPFELESMTAEDTEINIVCKRDSDGHVVKEGYFYLGFIDPWGELDFAYDDKINPNTPYIIYFPRFEGTSYEDYWSEKEVTFTSKHTEHKVLLDQPTTKRITKDQLIGNLTMQPQTIQGPFYTLTQDTMNDFVLQKEGTAVLQPFECYVVPKQYPVNVAMPTRLRAPRFGQPSTPTDVVPAIKEEMFTYYYDGTQLHIANQGHSIAIYSLTGQLIQTVSAETTELSLSLERGCYIICSEGISQKIAF